MLSRQFKIIADDSEFIVVENGKESFYIPEISVVNSFNKYVCNGVITKEVIEKVAWDFTYAYVAENSYRVFTEPELKALVKKFVKIWSEFYLE